MGSKKYKGGAKFGLAQVPPGYEWQLQQLKDKDIQFVTVNERQADDRTITKRLNVGVGHIKLRIGEEIEICFPNTLLHSFRSMVEFVQLTKTERGFSFFHENFGQYYERYEGLSVIGPLKFLEIVKYVHANYPTSPTPTEYTSTRSEQLLKDITRDYIRFREFEEAKLLKLKALYKLAKEKSEGDPSNEQLKKVYKQHKSYYKEEAAKFHDSSIKVKGVSSAMVICLHPNTVEKALQQLPAKIDTVIPEITLPAPGYYMPTVGVGCVANVDFQPITGSRSQGEKELHKALRLTLKFLLDEVFRERDENIKKIKVYVLWYLLTDNNLYKLIEQNACKFINPQEWDKMLSEFNQDDSSEATSLPKYLVADGYKPLNSVYFSYDGRKCAALNVCGTEIIFQHDKKFYVLPTGEETAMVALDSYNRNKVRVYESVMVEKVSTLARIISYKPKMISLHIHASCAYYEYGISNIIWIIFIYRLWFAEFQLVFYKKRYIRTEYGDIVGISRSQIKLGAILSLSINLEELQMISLLLPLPHVLESSLVVPREPINALFQLLNIMLEIYNQMKEEGEDIEYNEEYWMTWKNERTRASVAMWRKSGWRGGSQVDHQFDDLYCRVLKVFRETERSRFLTFCKKYEIVHENSNKLLTPHEILVDVLFTPDDTLMHSLLARDMRSTQLVTDYLFLFCAVRDQSPSGTLNLALVKSRSGNEEYDHFEFKGHGELNEYYQEGSSDRDDDMNKAVRLQKRLGEYYRDIYNLFKTAINQAKIAMSDGALTPLRLPLEECNRELSEHFAELE